TGAATIAPGRLLTHCSLHGRRLSVVISTRRGQLLAVHRVHRTILMTRRCPAGASTRGGASRQRGARGAQIGAVVGSVEAIDEAHQQLARRLPDPRQAGRGAELEEERVPLRRGPERALEPCRRGGRSPARGGTREEAFAPQAIQLGLVYPLA